MVAGVEVTTIKQLDKLWSNTISSINCVISHVQNDYQPKHQPQLNSEFKNYELFFLNCIIDLYGFTRMKISMTILKVGILT
jgi:hypothetical protein